MHTINRTYRHGTDKTVTLEISTENALPEEFYSELQHLIEKWDKESVIDRIFKAQDEMRAAKIRMLESLNKADSEYKDADANPTTFTVPPPSYFTTRAKWEAKNWDFKLWLTGKK